MDQSGNVFMSGVLSFDADSAIEISLSSLPAGMYKLGFIQGDYDVIANLPSE